jgi:hypothetical protein
MATIEILYSMLKYYPSLVRVEGAIRILFSAPDALLPDRGGKA